MSLNENEKSIELLELIKEAYENILNEQLKAEEKINMILTNSGLERVEFGWRLFEYITSNAQHPKTQQYILGLEILKFYFKMFPENKRQLSKSYPRMVANMIVGAGNTGFILRDKGELRTFLSDFKNFGYVCYTSEILEGLFKLTNIKKHIISNKLFKKISYYFNLEPQIKQILRAELEQPFVVALLAESYLNFSNYRFEERGDYQLAKNLIKTAKNTRRDSVESLAQRADGFLKALLIVLAYDQKTIEFCFANYFYDKAQVYYNLRRTNIALICYDYARKFFDLRQINDYKLSSEGFYYHCLAKYYSEEKKFDNQEITLYNEVNTFQVLIEQGLTKFRKPYYRALTDYILHKTMNTLYKYNLNECLEFLNEVLSDENEELQKIIEQEKPFMLKKLKSFKYETKGRIKLLHNDIAAAISYVDKALDIYNELEKDYHHRDYFKLSQFKKYLIARLNEFKGNNVEALKVIDELIKSYRDIKFVSYDYIAYSHFIKAKISLLNADIKTSLNELSQIINNEKADYFNEIIEKSHDLFNILSKIPDYEDEMVDLETDIFNIYNEPQFIKSWKIKLLTKEYDLPLKGISCEKLKLDLSHHHFSNLIKNFENKMFIQFPETNGSFYPILETIILYNLKKDVKINELIKSLHEDDQREPLIISSYRKIIDGNYRLAAYKLSKLISEENKLIKPLPYDKVVIVQIPETLTQADLIEIKTRFEYQKVPEFRAKISRSLKKMIRIKELIINNFPRNKITGMLNIDESEVDFYLSLHDLIEEFLEERDFTKNFFLIERFDVFNHFEKFNSELKNIDKELGLEGSELFAFRNKIKKIFFLWLSNNFNGDMISKNYILRVDRINRLKYILRSPKHIIMINNIIQKEITDKEEIHKILDITTNQIKITEERKGYIEHVGLLGDRISILKERIDLVKLNDHEYAEVINLLNHSQAEIFALIETIKNRNTTYSLGK